MRQVSYWAKSHLTLARIVLVLSKLLLAWIAYFLGTEIFSTGAYISPLWTYLLMLLFLLACLTYPGKKEKRNYSTRKMHDLAVNVSGFLLFLFFIVQLNEPFAIYQRAGATVPSELPACKDPEAQKLLQQFKNGEKISFSRKEKRVIRKEFGYQMLRYNEAKLAGNKEGQSNAAAIIFTCLLAVGLLFLVASFSCSLSCDGHDGAAAVVGIGGTALIVFGVVLIIRGLKKKKQQTQ